MELETVVDTLCGYNQLKKGTFLHFNKLTNEQVRVPGLRNQPFYVADGVIYSLEPTPTLWLTRHTPERPNNLVLKLLNILKPRHDPENSWYEQLSNNSIFHPDIEEVRTAMMAKDTLRVDLTKLRLEENNDYWSFLKISTILVDKLNAEERKLAERFYGEKNSFFDALGMLPDNTAQVAILNPRYVQKEAQQGPIIRAAWRLHFGFDFISYAPDYCVLFRFGLRGTRLSPTGVL